MMGIRKEEKSYFLFSNPVIPINNEMSLTLWALVSLYRVEYTYTDLTYLFTGLHSKLLYCFVIISFVSGGVTLLRAAAKNHARVTVICDPADYER